jgi:anion-transporting  ArsA/GET3 family ATPase
MNTDHTELMVVDQHEKAGRPTKYEPETVDRLLVGLADGLPIKSACITAGIGVSTLSDWREKYPELEVRMEEAREKARQKMLQRIKRAAEDDWRAAAEWLKLSFPNDYRRATSAGNTTTHNTQINTVVLSPEKQEQLREQRRRILATTKDAQHLAGRNSTQIAPMGLLVQEPAGNTAAEPIREAEIIEAYEKQPEQSEPAPQEPRRQPKWVTDWIRASNQRAEPEPEQSDDGVSRLG